MMSLSLSLLLLLCNSAFRAHGFNLETRLPIVKRSLEVSYFGYSVAGHQSFDEIKGEVENSWILVGAPIGKNLQPKTNQSGALYKCPLTSYHDDCIQVVTDGKRTIDSTKLSPPKNDEIKEGQWLGVIVRSQGRGRKVMVCAHRYINRGDEYQWGQGLCYTLTQNLDFVECWEPCKGRETEKGQAQFGYCQAGTSGMLLSDDTVVIGSPGSYNWKGNVFTVSVSDDFLHRDKTCYYSPVRDNEVSPVDSHSYLGMSTTADYLFGRHNDMVYAAGAPRANGTGQVVLFTKLRPSVNLMDAKVIISGEQFASSFGYELATADLNGDGEPDLIVGAPFYFTKETGGAVYIYMNNKDHCFNCKSPIKLVGKPESRFGFAITNLGDLNKDGYHDIAIGAPYEGNGVIYIYQGSDHGIIVEPSQIIRAEDLVVENLKISTLGYSLSGNGMDLDQNGYPDLISGAYESDMAILIRARPIVNITIEVRPPEKLRNIDPTKTGCSANITSSVTCFTFETCCTLESANGARSDGEWGIQLHYRLEAETFQEGRKFSRVWFGPDHMIKSQTIENIVTVDHNKKEMCQQHTAYIKENTMDIQSPIAMHISYSLVQNDVPVLRPGDPVPSLDDLPVLNQNQAEKTFFATFHKDCGNNDRCESRVHVNAELLLPRTPDDKYELVIGQHVEILLNTTAHNQGESAYESRMFVIHPYSFNYIGTVKLEDTKQVDCNPFNKTLVVCALGNPFKKSAISNIQLRFDPKELNDSENQLEFIVFSNSTSHEVEPQSPLFLRANIIKQAELSLKGLARPEQVFYGGQVKDDMSVKYRDEVGSRVLHTYQVFNSGPWKVSNLVVNIEWPYQVASHFTPRKWLLYLDEKPYVEAISGGECYMTQGQVNPLGLPVRPGVQEMPLDSISTENIALNSHMISKTTTSIIKNSSSGYYQNRVRREQNYVVGAETYVKDNGKHIDVVKMNCLVGNAKCFKFHCLINNLQKNQEATIFIKARLWNSTLLELFPKVDSVQIVSRAKIHLPPELSLQQNRSDDEFEVETTAKVDLLQQENEPIPWWIIILAILVGLLLLILLTLLLWKLGFFKRRRPDPTLSGNIEKHRVDDNYYDY
ncbi:integrin alpha-PS1 isoform X2 [Acyrthosiphon pisum]|uniref:Integrin alpha-PS1 n=1 Tax=Acyrthosiphon pisum TaxID=7029 RepID=A0A8R1W7B2_ACYPI|nr:integrin alpha-PS1 isoform X2 [Acyrthosiphon pisum]|eukprot:XP_003246766.1 PREDICTED: integrin alpha-PS1 isoform X2 [Acyrthosiphon pisum]